MVIQAVMMGRLGVLMQNLENLRVVAGGDELEVRMSQGVIDSGLKGNEVGRGAEIGLADHFPISILHCCSRCWS